MNDKRQITLFIGICAVVSLTLLIVFIWPFFSRVKESSAELTRIKKELAVIDDKTGNIKTLKETCSMIGDNLQRAENLLIDKKVPVNLIEYLENSANSSNVLIKVSPISLKEISDDLWDFMSFRLNVSGSYQDFMSFFEKLEAGPFLVEIKDLSVKGLTSSDLSVDDFAQFSIGDVTATITIRVFAK